MSSNYLKNLTTEQRAEFGRKAAATRAANKALKQGLVPDKHDPLNMVPRGEIIEEPEDVSMNETSGAITEPDVEEPPPPIGDPNDPFSMWMLTLEPETIALFTLDELRAAFEENWKKAQQEKRAKKRKELAESALASSRAHQGLLPAEQLERIAVAKQNARPVKLMITLPPAQANGQPADVGLRVDGKILRDGDVVYCTYGEAASYREMMYRAGQHELQFKGEGIRYRSWLLGRSLGMQGMTYEGH